MWEEKRQAGFTESRRGFVTTDFLEQSVSVQRSEPEGETVLIRTAIKRRRQREWEDGVLPEHTEIASLILCDLVFPVMFARQWYFWPKKAPLMSSVISLYKALNYWNSLDLSRYGIVSERLPGDRYTPQWILPFRLYGSDWNTKSNWAGSYERSLLEVSMMELFGDQVAATRNGIRLSGCEIGKNHINTRSHISSGFHRMVLI